MSKRCCPTDDFIASTAAADHVVQAPSGDELRCCDVSLICSAHRHVLCDEDGDPVRAPLHGPALPGRRDHDTRPYRLPADYSPPSVDVSGITAEAVIKGDHDRGYREPIMHAIARWIVNLGGYGPTDRNFLLGVAEFIAESGELDLCTADAWVIAARVVVGEE